MESSNINNFYANYPKFSIDEVVFNNAFINTETLNNQYSLILKIFTNACKEFLVSEISLSFSHCAWLKQNTFLSHIGLEEVIIVFEFNFTEIIIASVDQNLLREIIANSLMGQYSYDIKPFSETEKGMIIYYLAKIFFKSDIENIKIINIYHKNNYNFEHKKSYIRANIKANLGESNYSIGLFLPKNIIKNDVKNKKIVKNIIKINDYFILILKTIKISYEKLQKIKPGDIFILDNPNFRLKNKIINGNICALWKDFTYTVELKVIDDYYCATFICRGFDMMEELIENDQETNTKDISLDLTIELGKIVMSLQNLELLQNGSILELNKSIQDTLDITINKQKIGSCTPIQIEGKLGIKIISIFNNLDTQKHE